MNQKTKRFFDALKAKIKKNRKMDLSIALDLHKVKTEALFKEAGYETFGAWASAELPMHPTEATRFARVGRVFGALRFNRSLLLPARHMFWLSYIVDQSNVEEWLTKAQSMSQREVEVAVRVARGCPDTLGSGRGRKVGDSMTIAAMVTRQEMVTIETCIAQIIEAGIASSRGEAIALACDLASGAISGAA